MNNINLGNILSRNQENQARPGTYVAQCPSGCYRYRILSVTFWVVDTSPRWTVAIYEALWEHQEQERWTHQQSAPYDSIVFEDTDLVASRRTNQQRSLSP